MCPCLADDAVGVRPGLAARTVRFAAGLPQRLVRRTLRQHERAGHPLFDLGIQLGVAGAGRGLGRRGHRRHHRGRGRRLRRHGTLAGGLRGLHRLRGLCLGLRHLAPRLLQLPAQLLVLLKDLSGYAWAAAAHAACLVELPTQIGVLVQKPGELTLDIIEKGVDLVLVVPGAEPSRTEDLVLHVLRCQSHVASS